MSIKKILICTTVLAVSVLLSSCWNWEEKIVLREGDPAPLFSLNDINGKIWSLEELKGKVVLVNFWATWCPPCRAEMPELNAFYEAHKDESFVLVGISSGDTKEQIEDFIQEYGLSFPMWQDPTSASLRAFHMDYLPNSFVIDPSGTVRLAWTGAISLETLETYVAPLLVD